MEEAVAALEVFGILRSNVQVCSKCGCIVLNVREFLEKHCFEVHQISYEPDGKKIFLNVE